MFAVLLAIEVFIAIVLVIVVLMQSSKGGGLAGTFGGGSVGVVFGVRRTADFLIRATQILAGTFIVLSLLINMFFLPKTENVESVLQQSSSQTVPAEPQLPPSQPPLDQIPPGE